MPILEFSNVSGIRKLKGGRGKPILNAKNVYLLESKVLHSKVIRWKRLKLVGRKKLNMTIKKLLIQKKSHHLLPFILHFFLRWCTFASEPRNRHLPGTEIQVSPHKWTLIVKTKISKTSLTQVALLDLWHLATT